MIAAIIIGDLFAAGEVAFIMALGAILEDRTTPVDKSIGHDVFCGTINRFGAIKIRATKVGEDRSLQKLISMVQEAENNIYPELEKLRTQGKASILVATENNCIGIIALSDVLRPESENVISKLKELNTDSVLLTGDNKLTAECFAKQIGITQVMLPSQ